MPVSIIDDIKSKVKTGTIYTLEDSRAPGEIRYVGLTTKRIEDRLKRHLRRPEKTKKWSWIQSVLSGGGTVVIKEIERCDASLLIDRERATIAAMSASGHKLTNGTSGGEGFGVLTDEAKRKISASNKGRTLSQESREKISKAKLGVKQSDDVIQRRAASLRGKKRTQEQCERISNAKKGHGLGRTLSKETRKKQSIAHFGKKRPPMNQEWREKISIAGKGRKQTSEAIAARVEGIKRYHAAIRHAISAESALTLGVCIQ